MAERTVPSQFLTIAAAAAASQPGDTINILSGYSGSETSNIEVSGLVINVTQQFGQIILTLIGSSQSISADGLGDIQLRGNELSNIIIGNAGQNFIRGGLGDDTIDGGSQSSAGFLGDWAEYTNASGSVEVILTDPLTVAGISGGSSSGAAGNDTLLNIENIRGGSFSDTLTGNALTNVLRGGLGNDTVDGGAGIDWADYFNASGAVQVILTDATTIGGSTGGTSSGADGNDMLRNIEYIRGGNFGDTLTGNSGSNFLRGGLGDDTLDGGEGSDWADYQSASGTVQVILTDAVTNGGATGGTTSGADGNDTLRSIENIRGSFSSDVLTGNSSGNFLRGGLGNDTLDGGAGVDWADYTTAGDAVQVFLTDAIASGGPTGGASSGSDGNDTLRNIENIAGSGFADVLTGNSQLNFLWGGLGDDTIDGGAGADWVDYINIGGAVQVTLTDATTSGGSTGGSSNGAAGNDTLRNIESIRGSAFADVLSGNASVNFLRGGLGDDTLDGGAGVDWADYFSAGEAVQVFLTDAIASGGPTGGASSGSDGNDTLRNIENIAGSGFADVLTGNSQLNILWGGLGDDTIDGGAGADWADYINIGGAVQVTLTDATTSGGPTGGASNGAAGNDTLRNIENIRGSAFADNLTGNSGVNSIEGGLGNDSINAGAGIDFVVFQGVKSDYEITKQNDGSYLVVDKINSRDGSDALISVERLKFSDQIFSPEASAFYLATVSANLSQFKAISAVYQVLVGGVPAIEGYQFLINGNLSSNFGAGPGPIFNDENMYINIANALVQGNDQALSKFNQIAEGRTIETKIAAIYSKIIPANKQTPEGLAFITRPEGIQFYRDVANERGILIESGPAVVALASLLKIAVDGKIGVGNAVSDLLLSVADGTSELPSMSPAVLPIETVDGILYDADDFPDAAATTPPPLLDLVGQGLEFAPHLIFG